jgi:hypothetical protein
MNFILDVPPYPAQVMVSINQSNKKLIKSVKKWKIIDKRSCLTFVEAIEEEKGNSKELGGMIHDLTGTGIMILRIYSLVKSAESRGNLAHEIFHITEKIADFVGIKHCSRSSEAFAYMISYLTEEIYKKLK